MYMWALAGLRLGLNPAAQPFLGDCLSGWCSTDSSAMLKQSKYLEKDNSGMDFQISSQLVTRSVDD